MLKEAEIAISMDGKGAWRDNVFVERLWRTVKYEEVYLRAYASVSEARASIGRYLGFYNGRRGPIRRLAGRRPTKPISTSRRQSRRRRNPGGDPLSRSPEAVQTNRATSTGRSAPAIEHAQGAAIGTLAQPETKPRNPRHEQGTTGAA